MNARKAPALAFGMAVIGGLLAAVEFVVEDGRSLLVGGALFLFLGFIFYFVFRRRQGES